MCHRAVDQFITEQFTVSHSCLSMHYQAPQWVTWLVLDALLNRSVCHVAVTRCIAKQFNVSRGCLSMHCQTVCVMWLPLDALPNSSTCSCDCLSMHCQTVCVMWLPLNALPNSSTCHVVAGQCIATVQCVVWLPFDALTNSSMCHVALTRYITILLVTLGTLGTAEARFIASCCRSVFRGTTIACSLVYYKAARYVTDLLYSFITSTLHLNSYYECDSRRDSL